MAKPSDLSVVPRALDVLESGAAELGLHWNAGLTASFEKYLRLLIEWNQKFNLTAITDPVEIAQKHFLDSLTLVKGCDFSRAPMHMADVGTGAGFPGLPIKIFFPHVDLTLIDSVGKKIRFVREALRELKIEKAQAVQGRAEELGAPGQPLHEKFDFVAARAVGDLPTLIQYGLPLLKPAGRLIAMKTPAAHEEWETSQKIIVRNGGVAFKPVSFFLPTTDAARTFFIVAKSARGRV